MKTTLDLPDELMRAIKVRAAVTDRKLKNVIAEAIALGLRAVVADEMQSAPAVGPDVPNAGTGVTSARPKTQGAAISRAALDAIFAAGDNLVRRGVDVETWMKTSRDVWR